MDEWGALYVKSLQRANVGIDRVRTLPGPTGRSVILTNTASGQRTMRTCTGEDGSLTADMLVDADFKGVQWWVWAGAR